MSEQLFSEMLEELRAIRHLLERPTPSRLLTAEELAEALGCSASYIYEHSEQLGALRIPSGGSRPRLRFDLETARERVADRQPKPKKKPRRAKVELLEIRGQK
jgi:predicted DNA-binding transcriptional regulator YafY